MKTSDLDSSVYDQRGVWGPYNGLGTGLRETGRRLDTIVQLSCSLLLYVTPPGRKLCQQELVSSLPSPVTQPGKSQCQLALPAYSSS